MDGNSTYHTQRRFTVEKKLLLYLMQANAEFLTVCEDYDACVNALEYWSHHNAPHARERADEYRTLTKELEKEITQSLATEDSSTE